MEKIEKIEKKVRATRFSQAMSDALVENYNKYQYVLKSKFSSTITNEKKREAWERVTLAVNAVNGGERKSVEKVKKRWEDMASAVKKRERMSRNEELRRLRTTGNGVLPDEVDTEDNSPTCHTLSECEQSIISILGPEAISGISGGIDTLAKAGPSNINKRPLTTIDPLSDTMLDCFSEFQDDAALPSCGATGHDDFEIKEVLIPQSTRPKKKVKKTLSDVQMEYFETATSYYRLKTEKLKLEMEILKGPINTGKWVPMQDDFGDN